MCACACTCMLADRPPARMLFAMHVRECAHAPNVTSQQPTVLYNNYIEFIFDIPFSYLTLSLVLGIIIIIIIIIITIIKMLYTVGKQVRTKQTSTAQWRAIDKQQPTNFIII